MVLEGDAVAVADLRPVEVPAAVLHPHAGGLGRQGVGLHADSVYTLFGWLMPHS